MFVRRFLLTILMGAYRNGFKRLVLEICDPSL